MYLIRKGEKPKPICRECKKLHSAQDCPIAKARRSKYPFMTMREYRKRAV